MNQEKKLLLKHGLDHVQLLQSLLGTLLVFTMEKFILLFSLQKIWLDISLENSPLLENLLDILEISNSYFSLQFFSMKAIAHNIRISDKKLNVIAKIVRGMEAKKALDILRFMPNK
jgi:hypothetical protein